MTDLKPVSSSNIRDTLCARAASLESLCGSPLGTPGYGAHLFYLRCSPGARQSCCALEINAVDPALIREYAGFRFLAMLI